MTVIAWDGKSLAVDRRGTSMGLAVILKKYKTLESGEIAVWCGSNDQGLMLADWYEKGADIETWPKFQKHDEWSDLVIASNSGIKSFERHPVAQVMEDKLQAWGSGRDFALGAMQNGATAEEAVRVASQFNVYCGGGVDIFHFENK